MQKIDINEIASLIAIMENLVDRFEIAQNKRDTEETMKIKKEIMKIREEIDSKI